MIAGAQLQARTNAMKEADKLYSLAMTLQCRAEELEHEAALLRQRAMEIEAASEWTSPEA